MKISVLAVSFLLLAESVAAADFRVIDFGQSCAEVASEESRLGSMPDGELRRNYQVYKGVYLDRVVKIHYNCSNDGSLARGTYLYSFNNLEEAVAFFDIAAPMLENQYGKPKVDGSSQEYRKLMSDMGVEITEYDKYVRLWESGGIKILLSAMRPSIHSENAGVGIDFSPIEK